MIFTTIFLLYTQSIAQKMEIIPEQHLNLFEMVGDTVRTGIDTTKEFEVSDFITFGEYKTYLNAIKQDSSADFYLSQFPDSNITIDDKIYSTYITDKSYDKYPVLGISWDNAMNYCKWKTLRANKKDTIEFLYRLPTLSEWLTAYQYYKANNKKHDFNEKYSDWLLNAFEESFVIWGDKSTFKNYYNYEYYHKKNGTFVSKRKLIIGSSYLYENNHVFSNHKYGLADEGYRHVAFRIVKVKISDYNIKSLFKYWELKL
jgi:hypothetical protein